MWRLPDPTTGYLSSRPPPLNKFSVQLRSAMESWPKLHTVIFSPTQYHKNVFDNVLPLLLQLSNLRNLTINTSCCNENHIPTLSQLRNLESLTIHSPSRAVLYLLPNLLENLQPALKTLQLMVCMYAPSQIRLCSHYMVREVVDLSRQASFDRSYHTWMRCHLSH